MAASSRDFPGIADTVTHHRFAPDGAFRAETSRGHRSLRGVAALAAHAQTVAQQIAQGSDAPLVEAPARRIVRRDLVAARGEIKLVHDELVFEPEEDRLRGHAPRVEVPVDRIRRVSWDAERSVVCIATEQEELCFDGIGARPLLHALSLRLDGPPDPRAVNLFPVRVGRSATVLTPSTLLCTARRLRILLTLPDRDELLDILFAELSALRTPRPDQVTIVTRDRELLVDGVTPALRELLTERLSVVTEGGAEERKRAPLPTGTEIIETVVAELAKGELRPVRVSVSNARVVVDGITAEGSPAGLVLNADRGGLRVRGDALALELAEGPVTVRLRGPASLRLSQQLNGGKQARESLIPVPRRIRRGGDEQRECFRASAPSGSMIEIRPIDGSGQTLGPTEQAGLVDLSPGGCRILRANALAPNTRLCVTIQLEEAFYDLHAHVAWTRPAVRGFHVGLAFDALPVAAVTPLERTWMQFQRGGPTLRISGHKMPAVAVTAPPPITTAYPPVDAMPTWRPPSEPGRRAGT
ncbi:MAG: PilZ domain-containing protein [Myxococcales bacterium]|nr:PilZ domain-containing protein [Myxococcales bacterium]